MVGKWHLGHAQETYHPNQRGFEHFYGHLHTEVGYFPPFANQGGKDFQRNGVSIDDEGYETELLAREASRYIKARDPDRPFFLYMPFLAPHTPLEAPEDLHREVRRHRNGSAPGAQPSNRRNPAHRQDSAAGQRPAPVRRRRGCHGPSDRHGARHARCRGHRGEHHRAVLQRQRRRGLTPWAGPTTRRCGAARARPSRAASE